MSRPRLRRLVLCAVLCAVALGIFVLEAQIPLPLPFPGIKLGLSNIVTLLALALLGWKEALGIVLGRVLLGNLLLGQPSALLYALAGGLLSWLCMALLSRALPKNQLWVCGVCGHLRADARRAGRHADAAAALVSSAHATVRPRDRSAHRHGRAAGL